LIWEADWRQILEEKAEKHKHFIKPESWEELFIPHIQTTDF
jgi:hypothetical protein